jgi:ubiquinone/menaquinone biosynthesis C-methylase UbiE
MPTIHDAHATMFGLARHGELYERWAGRLAGRLYARVTADLLAAALPPGARILDAGTGPGLLPLRIAAACPQLTVDAVDLSPQMIDRAQQSAATAQTEAVTFTVADVAALPSRTPRSTSSYPPSASTTGPTPAPDSAS